MALSFGLLENIQVNPGLTKETFHELFTKNNLKQYLTKAVITQSQIAQPNIQFHNQRRTISTGITALLFVFELELSAF